MELKLIMYSSLAVTRSSGARVPQCLTSVVHRSRKENRHHGITGALYHHKGRYLQILEGEHDAVNRLMSNILKDPRHKSVRILINQASDQRWFPDWKCSLNISLFHDIKLRHFLNEYSPEIERFSQQSRRAFNYFYKAAIERRVVSTKEAPAKRLRIIENALVRLIARPNFAKESLTPLTLELSSKIKDRPYTLDELVHDFGESKRNEVLSLLRNFKKQGLIEIMDELSFNLGDEDQNDLVVPAHLASSSLFGKVRGLLSSNHLKS